MQLVANVLLAASAIVLVGLGFSLIFSVTRFFHFAHGILFTAAAYLAFLFAMSVNLPLAVSLFLSLALTVLIGCGIEIAIYRPLRRKGSSALILLLASLGVYIVLQNLIAMVFGDETKTLRSGKIVEGFYVFGARITGIQMATIALSALLFAVVMLISKKTKLGRAMRAVADDSELAKISGINSDGVILWTFALGSFLAGVAGILVALDVDMTPTMGMAPLMLGVVAVIIGGVGNLPGVAFGSVLLGLAQQLGAWTVGSQWHDVTAFVVLLVFLLVKPQGFFGRRGKPATV